MSLKRTEQSPGSTLAKKVLAEIKQIRAISTRHYLVTTFKYLQTSTIPIRDRKKRRKIDRELENQAVLYLDERS